MTTKQPSGDSDEPKWAAGDRTESYYEMRSVYAQIDKWISTHRGTPIDVPRLVTATRLDPSMLTEALFRLASEGMLRHVFRFKTPGGQILAKDYTDLDDIPEDIHDEFDGAVSRDDGEILSIFLAPDVK